MAKSIAQVDDVVLLEDLLEAIEKVFDNLQKCFYSIECHDNFLDLKDGRSLKFIRDNGKSVKVTKDVTGFGDVEVSDIQKHTNLKFSNADNVDIDNSRFPESALGISESVQALISDLKTRVQNVSMGASTSEATKRELISPIIMYTLAVVNAERGKPNPKASPILLSGEKWLQGRWGHGPLDFAARVQDYTILVAEAKKANLNEGIIQNLAQLCANQEYLAMTKFTAPMDRASRKRK